MTACSGRAFSALVASLPVSNPRPLSSFFASAAATCRESLGAEREKHLAPLCALIARSPPAVPREELRLLFFARNKLETRPGLGAKRTTADASIRNRYMYQNRALQDVCECQTQGRQRYLKDWAAINSWICRSWYHERVIVMVEKIGLPSEHFALQASRFFGLLAELQLNATGTWLPYRESLQLFRSASQSRSSWQAVCGHCLSVGRPESGVFKLLW